jgi:hypothetical protein
MSTIDAHALDPSGKIDGSSVAAKATATSQDWRDASFFGYTTRFVAGGKG